MDSHIEAERSAGFIAYKENAGERSYLIIRQTNGDYGFPKGHIEDGESEYEAATRELYEETGIMVKPIESFIRRISYPIRARNGVIKEATYYLGEALSDAIQIQPSEITDAFFLSYNEALNRLSFESTRDILRDAEKHLNDMKAQ